MASFSSALALLLARSCADQALHLSTLGVGTYLGEADGATDEAVVTALLYTLSHGWNVIDTGALVRRLAQAGPKVSDRKHRLCVVLRCSALNHCSQQLPLGPCRGQRGPGALGGAGGHHGVGVRARAGLREQLRGGILDGVPVHPGTRRDVRECRGGRAEQHADGARHAPGVLRRGAQERVASSLKQQAKGEKAEDAAALQDIVKAVGSTVHAVRLPAFPRSGSGAASTQLSPAGRLGEGSVVRVAQPRALMDKEPRVRWRPVRRART